MRNLNVLLAVAAILAVLWIVGTVTRFIAGVLLNLLWIVAIILLVLWAIRRLR
jgi:hypothetical protein